MDSAAVRWDDGFTLIELLVVVIIIGILATIAIPTYLHQREQGWRAQLVSDVRNAILDVEAGAVAANGSYPADQAEFDALGPEISDPVNITLTYEVSADLRAFCVEGRHVLLPAPQQVAQYVSGDNGGVATLAACPAL